MKSRIDEEVLKDILEFTRVVGQLKKIDRSGWDSKVGVKNPESVADHIFRSAVLAMVFGDIKNLDTERMMRMALLHELEEIIIGDLVPEEQRKIPNLQEKKLEAVNKILSHLPPKIKNKYLELWVEFEEEKSEEAKIVKELEKLELAIQAMEYEKEGYKRKDLNEFYEFVKVRLKNLEIKRMFEFLTKER